MGRAHHHHPGRDHSRTDRGNRHAAGDADRDLVPATRRLWGTTLLDADRARRHAGLDRQARPRCRFRLWQREWHGPAPARRAKFCDAGNTQSDRVLHPRRAYHGNAGKPRRRSSLQWPRAEIPRYANHLVGRRQSLSPSSRSQPHAARLGAGRDHHCAGTLVDIARAPRRYRAARHHHAGTE